MNNIINILYNIPYDILVNHIYQYISNDVLVWLNKDYYIKYHNNIIIKLGKNNFDSYIRFIIKNDLCFPFKQIISNPEIFLYKNFFLRKYNYKSMYFDTYYDFFNYYSIENNSNNCKNIINSLYNKKKYKQVKIRNNKWKN